MWSAHRNNIHFLPPEPEKMSTNTRNVASAGKKKGGGFLARQAKAKERKEKNALSEEELAEKECISPDDVLKLNKITEGRYIFLSILVIYSSQFCFQSVLTSWSVYCLFRKRSWLLCLPVETRVLLFRQLSYCLILLPFLPCTCFDNMHLMVVCKWLLLFSEVLPRKDIKLGWIYWNYFARVIPINNTSWKQWQWQCQWIYGLVHTLKHGMPVYRQKYGPTISLIRLVV